MPPLAGWARTIDLALVLLLAYLVGALGRRLGPGGPGPGPLPPGRAARPRRVRLRRRARPLRVPAGGAAHPAHLRRPGQAGHLQGPGRRRCNACVLKAFCTPHDEGRHVYRSLAEFHETDVGPVPPPALADHPGGLGALRPRRYDRLVGQARRVAAPRRGVHQPGAALARPPRLPSDADEAARPRGLGGRGDGRPLRIAASRVRDGPSSPTRNRPWPIPAQSSTDREEHGYRRLDEHPENSSARPNGRRDSPIQG